MSKTVFKRNREVAPEQLVQALTDVMQATLPLELHATRITAADAWRAAGGLRVGEPADLGKRL